MPYRVYCRSCDIEDAVQTKKERDNWHGPHAVDSQEISEVEYGRIKRGKRPSRDSYSRGSAGDNSSGYGGTCPLCGKEYEGAQPAHLRNECKA